MLLSGWTLLWAGWVWTLYSVDPDAVGALLLGALLLGAAHWRQVPALHAAATLYAGGYLLAALKDWTLVAHHTVALGGTVAPFVLCVARVARYLRERHATCLPLRDCWRDGRAWCGLCLCCALPRCCAREARHCCALWAGIAGTVGLWMVGSYLYVAFNQEDLLLMIETIH